MTVETTIALPDELLRAVDERSGDFGGRSRLIEVAVRTFLGRVPREELRRREEQRTREAYARQPDSADDAYIDPDAWGPR